jgi:hypothetical protein
MIWRQMQSNWLAANACHVTNRVLGDGGRDEARSRWVGASKGGRGEVGNVRGPSDREGGEGGKGGGGRRGGVGGVCLAEELTCDRLKRRSHVLVSRVVQKFSKVTL